MKAEYINHMGDDDTVASSARVSFEKDASEFDLSCNKRLINYLARHNHFTPFTHCMITLRETVPIFVARQRFKSMVGFTYNEISRRYVDTPPEFYVPKVWRERAENKKQGSGGSSEYSETAKVAYEDFCQYALNLYQDFISAGIAPEMARMLLPQATMTSYYVTGSLAAFARAYKLRIAEDSQKEIQDLAKQWDEIISPLYPESWKVLKE